MGEWPELEDNGRWRMAVWALRVGFDGLLVVLAGVIALAFGGTSWVLAVGMFIWLTSAGVTAVGFLWSRHDLSEPRPGFWTVRFLLLRDTFSTKPSNQRTYQR